jgi:electron transport complex protein RnfD
MTTAQATPRNASPSRPSIQLRRRGLGPHWHGTETNTSITYTWILVAAIPAVAGVMRFGRSALATLALCIATCVVVEFALLALRSQRFVAFRRSEGQAVLTGLLVGLTLPADATSYGWIVPVATALIASLVGYALPGGHGNYLWHPVVIGRVGAGLLFAGALHAPDAVQHLADVAAGGPAAAQYVEPDRSPITVLIRDHLPAFDQLLYGTASTSLIGGSHIALLAALLVLTWRGQTRAWCVIAALLAAALAAFVLPVRVPGGPTIWFPGLTLDEGLPVGIVYVLYHLVAGELLLVVVLLAGDPVSSPLTSRGQRWFGAGIGLLTIALRNLGLAATAGFWALLAMNTLVPLIDRFTKRKVYGTR